MQKIWCLERNGISIKFPIPIFHRFDPSVKGKLIKVDFNDVCSPLTFDKRFSRFIEAKMHCTNKDFPCVVDTKIRSVSFGLNNVK